MGLCYPRRAHLGSKVLEEPEQAKGVQGTGGELSISSVQSLSRVRLFATP